jgi:uncharacterized protein YigE (DUF2233 family)
VTTVADDDSFRLLIFPVRVAGARFRVVDLAMERDLERVLRETGASFVVNGGFFDPAERPEGLVISAGEVLSARSDELGGGIVAVAGERAVLWPTEGFAAPPGTEFAIQARPRLVVDGAQTSPATTAAPRSGRRSACGTRVGRSRSSWRGARPRGAGRRSRSSPVCW